MNHRAEIYVPTAVSTGKVKANCIEVDRNLVVLVKKVEIASHHRQRGLSSEERTVIMI